jgi:hypothetical protein
LENTAVHRTLDEFDELHQAIAEALGKDKFPKRMVFKGLEEQRVVLDEWLQGTLRSLPPAPSVVQTRVLAFLEVSTVGGQMAKEISPNRPRRPKTGAGGGGAGGHVAADSEA